MLVPPSVPNTSDLFFFYLLFHSPLPCSALIPMVKYYYMYACSPRFQGLEPLHSLLSFLFLPLVSFSSSTFFSKPETFFLSSHLFGLVLTTLPRQTFPSLVNSPPPPPIHHAFPQTYPGAVDARHSFFPRRGSHVGRLRSYTALGSLDFLAGSCQPRFCRSAIGRSSICRTAFRRSPIRRSAFCRSSFCRPFVRRSLLAHGGHQDRRGRHEDAPLTTRRIHGLS